MNYKVVLIIMLLVIGKWHADAQDHPIHLGIKGGGSLSKIISEYETMKMKPGYLVGLTVDFNIHPKLAVMTGLEMTRKGTYFYANDFYINASYFQVPVHMGFKIKVNKNMSIVPHLGPYMAYGFQGKTKEPPAGHIFNTYTDMLNRFDFGISGGAGVQYKSFFFDLNVEKGLIGICSYDIDLYNAGIFATVVYKVGL